jgi:hypothetical protein
MAYTFKGRLCGFICDECPEPLSDVVVRLYRHRQEQDVTTRAVASPKDTFAILTDDQVKAKAASLIAEAKTDAAGSFTFELGDKQRYNGEAFEVDVFCGTVPHRKPGRKTPPPLQFSVTSLQPMWRPTDGGFVGAWEYCIPARYWCPVRLRFGAWTICGRVIVCDTKDPVAGVKVTAFDRDWIQDDNLGSAITDGTGKFRIDYLKEDFEKTPFSPLINFECVPGPDLYFRVETTAGGTVLLNEPPSRGRDADRENVGPCFCVDLCIDLPPGDGENPIPLFTHVGQYRVDPIYGDFTADGLTTAGNLAFTDTIPLRGLLPNGGAPDALEYHFRWAEWIPDPMNPAIRNLAPLADVDQTMISPTLIGQLEYFDWDSVNSVWVLRAANYWANNPGAPLTTIHRNGFPDITIQLNQPVKPGGWIEVPRQSHLVHNGEGLFVGGFVDMVDLITTTLTSEFFDLTNPLPELKAGDSVPAPQQSRMHNFQLLFEARKVGTIPIIASNVLNKIVMSNTLYKQHHHPNWAGFVDTERPVVLVDIVELAGAGCTRVDTHVHALFTAYHPFLGSISVFIEGPGPLPAAFSPAIVNGQAASGAGGHDFDITGAPKCAYIMWLSITLNLTYGYGPFLPPFQDHVAFCKG